VTWDARRGYNPEGVGHNPEDLLGIFGLGPRAVWMDVQAEFRQFSQISHPDKHNPTRTNMSNEEAKAFFQLFNNARDFLENHFRRLGQI
jgi:curved DNA-binding protein CbpA